MLNNESKKPFVIFSSLTEDKGHLLLDDFFWFKYLSNYSSETRIVTSKTSAKRLISFFPYRENQISSFKTFSFLRKLNFRLCLLARLFFCEKIKDSKIIFQGFDELGLLFYLFRIRNSNNIIYIVPTNNVSPERLGKSKYILQILLSKIIQKSSYFLYHTDFELELLKKFISKDINLKKCIKIKYHLLGEDGKNKKLTSTSIQNQKIISFFGPTMSTKPYHEFIKLIKADKNGNGFFEYRIINVDLIVENDIKSILNSENKVNFYNEYLDYEKYLQILSSSTYVFLPHNKLYEGKLSGILSDCISNGIPIISDNIEPVLEFSKSYGKLGFVFDFVNDKNWVECFLENQNENLYYEFKQSLYKCNKDHNHELIITEFLEIN